MSSSRFRPPGEAPDTHRIRLMCTVATPNNYACLLEPLNRCEIGMREDRRKIALAVGRGDPRDVVPHGVGTREEIAGANESHGCITALARWGREIRDKVPRSDQEEQ
jgi:hypothetical protein